jgi:hypothetical protein
MALAVADRVKETTTTAGLADFVLGGATLGFQAFSVLGDGNTTYYSVAGQSTGQWEVGVGTYVLSTNTLTRDTILESSSANAKVNFSAGVKDIFVTYPSEYAVFSSFLKTVGGQSLIGTGNIPVNIDVVAYANRNTLRAMTPENNSQVIVTDLGLFVFYLGATEIDDDESCFATATGRWLIQAISWDFVEAWTMPRESLQEQQLAQLFAKTLTGSGVSGVTSIATLTQVSFNITVPGAVVGNTVAVSPPNALEARVAIFARVSAPNVVTVHLNNPSASTATLVSGVFSVTVFR